ncbi:methylated-DNA--[protein]-cysteine S-methyltransferase [Bradyrhizobium prioriisuperbiae]|uniref:methylated-DNA--[protein]-cysteine S-methyltransferase n=1 Tax=Bradyrhizobium prioriisuperbiae TaxID=2854389 RepID=UPI0028E4B4A3|nr:methylated-DNA--[protein]-cysteine S-methyltransferase [Bradyrhizobium prioritasuperba]
MFERVVSYTYVETRIGRLLLAGDAESLHLLSFQSGSRVHHPRDGWRHDPDGFPKVRRQLDEYFAGKRTTFTLPLYLSGTAFQNAVWTTLQSIPHGVTTTYRELAVRIGRPAAVRAVGAANGANPLPIIIPCHRVIGTNGSLTGFGGGIETKRFLLGHEGALVDDAAAGLFEVRAR